MQKSRLPVQIEKSGKNPDRPRVVLDTNVLVSAFLSPGKLPAQILLMTVRDTLQGCYSQAIIDEYAEVLSRPRLLLDGHRVRIMLEKLKMKGLFFNVQPTAFPLPDETDRVFYDVAKAAGAFLVTGNLKHYPEEPSIMSPRDLINTLHLTEQSADDNQK